MLAGTCTPTTFQGGGDSWKSKFSKESKKQNWNFQRYLGEASWFETKKKPSGTGLK